MYPKIAAAAVVAAADTASAAFATDDTAATAAAVAGAADTASATATTASYDGQVPDRCLKARFCSTARSIVSLKSKNKIRDLYCLQCRRLDRICGLRKNANAYKPRWEYLCCGCKVNRSERKEKETSTNRRRSGLQTKKVEAGGYCQTWLFVNILLFVLRDGIYYLMGILFFLSKTLVQLCTVL